jgi:aminoglycoside 3-N-acetyltransferase
VTETNLFLAPDGKWLSRSQIVSLLEEVDAASANVLYVHTGMTFGTPNPALARRELLGCLFDMLQSLRVPTLCFPTFTFSFCNGDDYCVQTSRSKMGALNEYVRLLPNAVRSTDPLMSSVAVGQDVELVQNLGKCSIGGQSTFDKLHQRGRVKFLFFGTTVSECFTYTHYVEERMHSAYRYQRQFRGKIKDGERSWDDEYTLFVRYKNAKPRTNGLLENDLLNRGLLRKRCCGASSISCVDEEGSYQSIAEQLRQNPLCYIDWDPGDRDMAFHVHNMVSL